MVLIFLEREMQKEFQIYSNKKNFLFFFIQSKKMQFLEIVPQGFTQAVESMNKISKTELIKDMVPS